MSQHVAALELARFQIDVFSIELLGFHGTLRVGETGGGLELERKRNMGRAGRLSLEGRHLRSFWLR